MSAYINAPRNGHDTPARLRRADTPPSATTRVADEPRKIYARQHKDGWHSDARCIGPMLMVYESMPKAYRKRAKIRHDETIRRCRWRLAVSQYGAARSASALKSDSAAPWRRRHAITQCRYARHAVAATKRRCASDTAAAAAPHNITHHFRCCRQMPVIKYVAAASARQRAAMPACARVLTYAKRRYIYHADIMHDAPLLPKMPPSCRASAAEQAQRNARASRASGGRRCRKRQAAAAAALRGHAQRHARG